MILQPRESCRITRLIFLHRGFALVLKNLSATGDFAFEKSLASALKLVAGQQSYPTPRHGFRDLSYSPPIHAPAAIAFSPACLTMVQ
jgi:hypothetical protein